VRRGPGALEAAAVLLAWVLFDLTVTGVHPFRASAKVSEALFYWLLGGLRLVEGLSLLAYWYARGWDLDALGLRGRLGRRGVLVGAGTAAALGGLVFGVEGTLRFAFGESFLRHVTPSAAAGRELAALLVVGGVLGPVFEEFLFRGILYGGLRKRSGVLLSTVLASMVFASAHYAFRSIHPVQAAGAVLFCIAYELSGSLWAPLILHVTGNLAIFLSPRIFPPLP
jgi:membrane protease YdiL (CAAX protease family)